MPPHKLSAVHIASGDLWGGAEAQVYTLATTLNRRDGMSVTVITLNDSQLSARLRSEGVPVRVVNERTHGPLSILLKIRHILREIRPDIVHTHRIKENVLGAVANLLSGHSVCVRTAHGAPEFNYSWRQPHKRLYQALDAWVGKHLQQRVVAVSEDLAEKLTATFKRPHIETIPNGVDIEAIRRAARLQTQQTGFSATSRHVGLIGRLVAVKRVDIFLELAATLASQPRYADVQFHVFGDGPLLEALQAQAKTLDLEERVTFHGHCDEIHGYLASLDALVICSDHEGLPMTALEAFTLETPLVAHATGGLLPLMAEDCGGILVSDHTAQGYAKALAALLDEDTTQRTARQHRAGQRLESRYSAAANADAVVALYRRLLAGGSTPEA